MLKRKTFKRRKSTYIARRGNSARWSLVRGWKLDEKLGRNWGFFMTVPAIPYERFISKRMEETEK